MKFNSGIFRGRFWLPGLIIGAVFFLSLAFYLGFQLQKNNQEDANNLQAANEIISSTTNVEFFLQDVVTGNSSGIDPLNLTLVRIQDNLDVLNQASAYTKGQLLGEFSQLERSWQSIGSDAEIAAAAETSINLLISMNSYLSAGSIEVEEAVIDSVALLSAKNAPRYQIELVSRQGLLLQEMSSNLGEFVDEESSTRASVEAFQNNLQEFEANHLLLTRGDDDRRPITDAQVLNNLEKIFSYEQVVGSRNIGSARPLFPAIEKILATKEARARLSTNLGAMRSSLSEMDITIKTFKGNRGARWIHIFAAAFGFLVSISGLILIQRLNAGAALEQQQEDSQRTQEAILRLLDELIDLADGDLTISATVSEDFTGAIADSINFTIDQLRQLVSRINSTAVQVSHAAQGTQQTAYHLAEASNHQAQEIAGASAAINEMAVTIDQVSANASESALVAGKSVSIANNGAKLVQNTIHGMDTIREQIQDTSKRIKRLGESSQEIGDIVSLINDIADQTNILALNAAIQASMAGDAGRGFAVVADEVQRLAERSAAATKQIETLVKTIQSDTNEAVISMEQTTSEVVRGARLAQDAGVALEEIEGVSANLAELIQNISNAARQQASSAGHISNTMNVIQEITSQTSAGTSETADSIGNLANMASDLRESVAGFTLPDEMLADLERQEISSTQAAPMPPVLDTMATPSNIMNQGSSDVDNILADLDFSDDDSAHSFSSASEDDDLLEEFDLDLSDIEFPDTGKQSAS